MREESPKASRRPQGRWRRPLFAGKLTVHRRPAMHEYGALGVRIKAHWKLHRPKMYAELEQAGTLEESVSTAESLTADALYDLTAVKKVPYDQA
jgi:hypothetical protein